MTVCWPVNFHLLCGADLQEGLIVSLRIKLPAYTCRTQLLGTGRWVEAGMARAPFEMDMKRECGNREKTAPKRTQPWGSSAVLLGSVLFYYYPRPSLCTKFTQCFPPRLAFLYQSLSYWWLWHTHIRSVLAVCRDQNRRADRAWPQSLSRWVSWCIQAGVTIWLTFPSAMCVCHISERHVDTEHHLSPQNVSLT